MPDATEAAEFYKKVFGGEEIARCIVDRSSVVPVKAVTMRIGEAIIHVSTANPRTPQTMDQVGGSEDVGSFQHTSGAPVSMMWISWRTRCGSGARQRGPIEDAVHGDRVAMIEDPFVILGARHRQRGNRGLRVQSAHGSMRRARRAFVETGC